MSSTFRLYSEIILLVYFMQYFIVSVSIERQRMFDVKFKCKDLCSQKI